VVTAGLTVAGTIALKRASEYQVNVPVAQAPLRVELWPEHIAAGLAMVAVAASGVCVTVTGLAALEGLSHPVVVFTHLAV
jgi:hypothetical protein